MTPPFGFTRGRQTFSTERQEVSARGAQLAGTSRRPSARRESIPRRRAVAQITSRSARDAHPSPTQLRTTLHANSAAIAAANPRRHRTRQAWSAMTRAATTSKDSCRPAHLRCTTLSPRFSCNGRVGGLAQSLLAKIAASVHCSVLWMRLPCLDVVVFTTRSEDDPGCLVGRVVAQAQVRHSRHKAKDRRWLSRATQAVIAVLCAVLLHRGTGAARVLKKDLSWNMHTNFIQASER